MTGVDVHLEAKYIRAKTTPSKAREGIAADLTIRPNGVHTLFVVYDPDHAIEDDTVFRDDFQSRGGCTVLIIH